MTFCSLLQQKSLAILPKCQNSRDTNFNLMAFLFHKEASLLNSMIPQIYSLLKFCQKNLFNHILNFTVAIKCGTTVAENNTYFESGGSESGSCTVKICPCSDNICQVIFYLLRHGVFELNLMLKFIFSEKATKFCKIFTLLLSYVLNASQK